MAISNPVSIPLDSLPLEKSGRLILLSLNAQKAYIVRETQYTRIQLFAREMKTRQVVAPTEGWCGVTLCSSTSSPLENLTESD